MFVLEKSVSAGCLLSGPAYIRSIRRHQLLNLVTVRHAQGRRCLQNPGQISIRVQTILFGCLNQTEINSAGPGSAGCIGEQKVFPGHHKWLNAAFRSLCEYSDKERYPNRILIRSFLSEQLKLKHCNNQSCG